MEENIFFFFVVNFVIHWNEKALGSHVCPSLSKSQLLLDPLLDLIYFVKFLYSISFFCNCIYFILSIPKHYSMKESIGSTKLPEKLMAQERKRIFTFRNSFPWGEELRWWRNRMGRPLSPLQIERWANFTKQLLTASRRHQVPRKAAHCLRKEIGQSIKDKKRDKRNSFPFWGWN